MKSTVACKGCRNDFYNGNNDLGVTRCWHVPKAKIVTRYRLHVDVPVNRRSAYQKVRVPSCYTEPRYIHVDKIPGYAQ